MTAWLDKPTSNTPRELRNYILCKLYRCRPSELAMELGRETADTEAVHEAIIAQRNKKLRTLEIQGKRDKWDAQRRSMEFLQMLVLMET